MLNVLKVIILLLTSVGALSAPLLPFHNSGVIEITDPERYDRIYAISDVHGMSANLSNLLMAQKIATFDSLGNAQWTAGKSLLIVVGDSIDKGPDSLGVLKIWMTLNVQAPKVGGGVLHLLGNHEAEFLADPTNKKAAVFLAELGKKRIQPEQLLNPQPQFPMAQFLRQMPLAARVGSYLFCHAGLYPASAWNDFRQKASSLLSGGVYDSPFVIGESSILEAKDWWKDPNQVTALESSLDANHFYGVVFGHQPGALGVREDITGRDQLKVIKIDSGMAPTPNSTEGSQPGHMLLFAHSHDLSIMAPPEVYSLSATTSRRLATE